MSLWIERDAFVYSSAVTPGCREKGKRDYEEEVRREGEGVEGEVVRGESSYEYKMRSISD